MGNIITPWLKKQLLWLLMNYPGHFFRLGINSLKLWQEPDIDYLACKRYRMPIELLVNPDFKSMAIVENWLNRSNCHILWYPDFPENLKNVSNPPVMLFCEGNVSLLKTLQLAMVGTRHPSIMGLAIAEKFAEIFTRYDITITSGLAAGIDTASHQGALKNKKTIAVMGTGILNTYPKSNIGLRKNILENEGLIISELPMCAHPQAWHFPLRNRLISGLSKGVLVVEAGLKSGSLITARLAGEQGKEIFAIPGAIYHQQSQGTLYLIDQGAKLVTKPEDVLEIMLPFNSQLELQNPVFGSQSQKIIWNILDEPLSFEEIICRTGLEISCVQFALLELVNNNTIIYKNNCYFRDLNYKCVSVIK